MRVGQLMLHSRAPIQARMPLAEAAALMEKLGVTSVPVSDGTRFVGVLDEKAIVAAAERGGSGAASTSVGEALGGELAFCHIDDDVLDVAQRLLPSGGLRELVVLDDDGRVAGLLTKEDLDRGTGSSVSPSPAADDLR